MAMDADYTFSIKTCAPQFKWHDKSFLGSEVTWSQPGGRLCQPHYYLSTRIWKPNGISAVYIYRSIDIKIMIFVKSV